MTGDHITVVFKPIEGFGGTAKDNVDRIMDWFREVEQWKNFAMTMAGLPVELVMYRQHSFEDHQERERTFSEHQLRKAVEARRLADPGTTS